MELERLVKRFYDGLAEGRVWGRRCLECGAIEFPPHYACNTCGYHETEWVELSGHGWLKTIMLPEMSTADSRLTAFGSYGFGEVELDEGVTTNVIVYGITEERRVELRERIAAGEKIGVHKKLVDLGGYMGLHFALDEDEQE